MCPRRTAAAGTCGAAVAWPDGAEAVVRGVVDGVVAALPRGDGGFGYDPIMVPVEGDGRTFAEMTAVEKHAISHRARAFRALLEEIDRPDQRTGPGGGGG